MRFKGDFITMENNTHNNLIEEDNIFSACSTKMLDPKIRHVNSK